MSGACRSHHEGDIFTLSMYHTSRMEHLPREKRLPRLREVFTGMGWITQQLLDDAPDPHAIFMDAVIQIQMPSCQDLGQKGPGVTQVCEQGLVKRRASLTDKKTYDGNLSLLSFSPRTTRLLPCGL